MCICLNLTLENLKESLDKNTLFEYNDEMNKKRNNNYVSKFTTIPEISIGNRPIKRGDTIKIKGEKGSLYSFWGLTTNPDNGIQWVDCFYLRKTQLCGQYSYAIERVVPMSRKRKNVNRT
jgi:hypothetical protein